MDTVLKGKGEREERYLRTRITHPSMLHLTKDTEDGEEEEEEEEMHSRSAAKKIERRTKMERHRGSKLNSTDCSYSCTRWS